MPIRGDIVPTAKYSPLTYTLGRGGDGLCLPAWSLALG